MAAKAILSLKWNATLGEAQIDFAGLKKLHGIERADFLDDVISMLQDYRESMGNDWAQDYTLTLIHA